MDNWGKDPDRSVTLVLIPLNVFKALGRTLQHGRCGDAFVRYFCDFRLPYGCWQGRKTTETFESNRSGPSCPRSVAAFLSCPAMRGRDLAR